MDKYILLLLAPSSAVSMISTTSVHSGLSVSPHVRTIAYLSLYNLLRQVAFGLLWINILSKKRTHTIKTIFRKFSKKNCVLIMSDLVRAY